MMSKLKLVIVGGGAITESVYIPILLNNSDFQLMAVIEQNGERGKYLKENFEGLTIYDSLHKVDEAFNAAIVATPNYLHKEVSIALLKKGVHVLVEKPMALSSADCEEMRSQANQNGVKLMVGMVRRYYTNMQMVKEIIEAKTFGELVSLSIKEGYVFNWPVTSDSLINKRKSGGGVLIDIGVHVLDLLFYWLGRPNLVNYYDDSFNQIEAECLISLSWPTGVVSNVQLSRLRELPNTIELTFEKGVVVVDVRPSDRVDISLSNKLLINGKVAKPVTDKMKPFKKQLQEFSELVLKGRVARTSIRDAEEGITLIQNCYDRRKNLSEMYQYY